MLLDKTGYVSQETRPKFINVSSIMANRRYMYRSLCTLMSFEWAAHIGKSYVNATQFRRVFRKTKKSWIEVCYIFCSYKKCKAVLVESANQFSLEEKRCVGHSAAWNIFRSHIYHQTLWKNQQFPIGTVSNGTWKPWINLYMFLGVDLSYKFTRSGIRNFAYQKAVPTTLVLPCWITPPILGQ